VVLVDANVLLYAVNDSMPQHVSAKRWIEQALLGGTEAVGFAWLVLLAFVRLATLRALFPSPLDPGTALDLVEDWLRARPAIIVHPTARHASVLRGLLAESGTAGNLVSDAHLAALCIEHGARICTFDRDFGRFRGVSAFEPA
jgi:toxin-antitoxin system PIN domain toxin